MIRVAVSGAAGRMGRDRVRRGRSGADDMELVGRADPALGVTLEQALTEAKPDVVVDFTIPDTVFENARLCLEHGHSRGGGHDRALAESRSRSCARRRTAPTATA